MTTAHHRPACTRLREGADTVAVPSRGDLRLVVVSDTHSAPHPALYRLVAATAPRAILHAGDIGDLTVLDRLAAIAPVSAVRGNTDGRFSGLLDVLVVTLTADDAPIFRILMTHVGLGGGIRLRPEVRARAEKVASGLVICGHTHVPLITRDGALPVFNPGSCGPRRPPLPITFGVIEWNAGGVALRHVDCETGSAWRPPTV